MHLKYNLLKLSNLNTVQINVINGYETLFIVNVTHKVSIASKDSSSFFITF